MVSHIRVICTAADYDAAISRIEKLWGAENGTADGNELGALALLVDAYEKAHWPTADLDPVDTLIAHMDLNDYGRADLAKVLSSTSRASEILNRRRALNLTMICAISAAWGLPTNMLIAEYKLAA